MLFFFFFHEKQKNFLFFLFFLAYHTEKCYIVGILSAEKKEKQILTGRKQLDGASPEAGGEIRIYMKNGEKQTLSFEGLLMQRSSKDTFKKAKAILHGNELVCCYEADPGVIRAVCRDGKGVVSRVEVQGFPGGPYKSVCSCSQSPNSFCQHAVAACLYHAKYTIKPKEKNSGDSPAQYAGLKFTELPALLKQVLVPQTASVTISTESDFPHMPSKWERIVFQVSLNYNGRQYAGNYNNLRQLQFGKALAVSLQLSSFPPQDRQIIRYLAINSQQDGSKLSLDAEQTAEFFHCLVGFQRFFRKKEKIVIHKTPALPAILVEDNAEDCLLRSAVIVNGVPLPLKDVKVITGRAGCWVGMLGEYWWIGARADVLWIGNFLRTTIQPCDKKTAETLFSASGLPFQVIETRKVKVSQRRFIPYYDGKIKPDNSLEIELLYNYSGLLCPGDQERYASRGGSFWLRDTAGERAEMEKLLNFGFVLKRSTSSSGRKTKLQLSDKEAIAVFVNEVIPRWLAEKKEFSMSSDLMALCGDSSSVGIDCKVRNETPEYFDLDITVKGGNVQVQWERLVEASERNEMFLEAGKGLFLKLSPQLRKFAAGVADIVTNVTVKSSSRKNSACETLRIMRPAVYFWTKLGDGVPGAVPVEFLRMNLSMEDASRMSEADAGELAIPLFKGDLRNYQKQGVMWISAMSKRGCNLVLADEMGLGKTIQALAMLVVNPAETLPALVICPTSLIENWARETEKFLPDLKVLVVSGNDRKNLWKNAGQCDVCITSYSLVRRDVEMIREIPFRYLILDEAQHIKNPATANAQSCKAIPAVHKLVLTGTPLENSPEDLWSIFDFLHSGFLGSLTSFRNRYILNAAPGAEAELAARMAPFMLRRKKADVHKELPPKQEQALCCEMGSAQRAFYEKFLSESRRLFEEFKKSPENSKNSQFEMLSALLRLRQICCAPELLPESYFTGEESIPGSAKIDLLRELLMESIDSGHKVLLFSQFTSLLRIVRDWMDSAGLRYEYLDGATQNRMEHVDRFNRNPNIPVFLLSLKAGGVGLNLTSADTVIIYDPWWNPAAEAQAADRSHRIGQTKSVNCIKLIVKDSIEEKVLELQKKKAELFESLVESPTEAMRHITMEDLEFLLK